jgi:transcriptional regulator with XRE-family HTH domain
VTPAQCKAARVLLDWTLRDLAQNAQVSHSTVLNLEKGKSVSRLTAIQVRRVLEDSGVEFVGESCSTDVIRGCMLTSGALVRLKDEQG